MPPLNTDWTEERLTELKRLFYEGHSFNQMADLLAVTRNSILGVCHRKGWKRDLPPSKALTAVHRAKRIKKKPDYRVKAPRPVANGGQAPTRGPFVDPVTEFDLATPPTQRKTLMELTAFTCRWPIGHPRDSDFFFCGATSSFMEYCPHHEARAWRRPPKRA
jgi:GcrA cell cycle regulator